LNKAGKVTLSPKTDWMPLIQNIYVSSGLIPWARRPTGITNGIIAISCFQTESPFFARRSNVRSFDEDARVQGFGQPSTMMKSILYSFLSVATVSLLSGSVHPEKSIRKATCSFYHKIDFLFLS
jgi:hypothetical protein